MTELSADWVPLTALTRRPASESVAVDDQDSHCNNEDEPGINAKLDHCLAKSIPAGGEVDAAALLFAVLGFIQ